MRALKLNSPSLVLLCSRLPPFSRFPSHDTSTTRRECANSNMDPMSHVPCVVSNTTLFHCDHRSRALLALDLTPPAVLSCAFAPQFPRLCLRSPARNRATRVISLGLPVCASAALRRTQPFASRSVSLFASRSLSPLLPPTFPPRCSSFQRVILSIRMELQHTDGQTPS